MYFFSQMNLKQRLATFEFIFLTVLQECLNSLELYSFIIYFSYFLNTYYLSGMVGLPILYSLISQEKLYFNPQITLL